MFKSKKDKEIITTHELSDYILKNGCIPTPIYIGKEKQRYKKNKKEKDEIVTTHELGDIILEHGVVPTPIYKDKKKNKKTLLFLLCLVIFLFSFLLIGCNNSNKRPIVDVNKYITAKLDGYNNYASVTFEIDYKSMISDNVKDKSAVSDLVDVTKKFQPFIPKYKESNVLKNGDIINVKWDENKEAVAFIEKMLKKDVKIKQYEYIVDGLNDPIRYNVFSELVINTNGTMSGEGVIDSYINVSQENKENLTINVMHNGNNGTLKNGDVITFTLDENFDFIDFTKTTGLLIDKTSIDYTIDCLCTELDNSNDFDKIDQQTTENINKVFEEWVGNGLNDESVSSGGREYEILGYIYFTNQNNKEGMFFTIYKVKDSLVLNPYYTFVGTKGVLTLDHNFFYVDGEKISDSFVDYEKEKVRYSESEGWIVGSEENGFLYDGLPFAGHKTLEETINYIKSVYGINYKKEIMSNNLLKK